MIYRFLIALLFFSMLKNHRADKKYVREYYASGELKAEGWMHQNVKDGFWKFYHQTKKISEQGHFKANKREKYWYFYTTNGKLEKEGHFKADKKTDWWLFYDTTGKVNHKCQLANNLKNGYCLKYKNETLTSAEKYKNGKKIKEWHSLRSFKKENNLSDLK